MSIDDEEELMEGMHITHFDPLQAIDKIAKNKKDFELFKDAVCDILDLEELNFIAKTLGDKESNGKEKGSTKRVRLCTARTIGSEFAPISEFSDGTFSVIGVLSALISKEYPLPLFCVEELENCLHPAALKRLTDFLRNNANRWPVLITTHSPYLLNIVNPAEVSIAVVDEDGAIQFKKIESRTKINQILNNKYISFGDSLEENFKDFLGEN